MSLEEIFSQLSLSNLSYFYQSGSGSVFGIRIRIHKILDTNQIWIRIHNTGTTSVRVHFTGAICGWRWRRSQYKGEKGAGAQNK